MDDKRPASTATGMQKNPLRQRSPAGRPARSEQTHYLTTSIETQQEKVFKSEILAV